MKMRGMLMTRNTIRILSKMGRSYGSNAALKLDVITAVATTKTLGLLIPRTAIPWLTSLSSGAYRYRDWCVCRVREEVRREGLLELQARVKNTRAGILVEIAGG